VSRLRASRSVAALLAALVLGPGCGDDGGAVMTTTTTKVTTTTAAVTTVAPTTTTAASTTTSGHRDYPQAALDYFVEVAFGPEFGSGVREIRKWTQDVKIAVHGDPNPEDLAALEDVIADLNEIIGTIEIEIVETGQNVDLHFAPEAQFAAIEPNYVPVNMGFFWVWWDGGGSFNSSRILVSTTDLSQAERNHIIREELTQSMGLMNDSFSYEDSMFYQEWTETPAYSDLDELLIAMLYLPQITPGMKPEEALALLGSG